LQFGRVMKDGPLAGIRVADLTWVRAGPQCTRLFSLMGAEVIRVEWPAAPDLTRLGALRTTPSGFKPGINTSSDFANFGVNKLSSVLNVRDPRGMDLLRRLIAISDLVVENFSSRVLDDWGLSYQDQARIRPDIIYISMAGFGHSGRWRDYDTWGPAVQAMTGLTQTSGMPGKPPSGWGYSYMDHTGGYYGTMALLTALHYRNRTGQGQYIDLAQVEAGCTLTGAAILDATVNGRPTRRPGFPPGNRTTWPGYPITNGYSRGQHAAPHNHYRAKGGGHWDWCVIVCRTQEEWRSLVHAMGSPEWAGAEKFATLLRRLENQEELDRKIGEWTVQFDKWDLMEKLQAAGVPCGQVSSTGDRADRDPQLRYRGTFAWKVKHPLLGEGPVEGYPAKFSETPWEVWRSGPMMASENDYLYHELLGLSLEEIDDLDRSDVLWPQGMARPAEMQKVRP